MYGRRSESRVCPTNRWSSGRTRRRAAEEKSKPVEKEISMIHVGEKVPDFVAPGYQQGKFINVKLSDYLGKWTLLCFYPGDFTFV